MTYYTKFCGLLLGLFLSTQISALNPQDSIFIESSTESDFLLFDHYIQPLQTLYSISRHYQVEVDDIKNSNPDINENFLTIGDTLKIPFQSYLVVDEKQKEKKLSQVFYKVRPGDTLYKIANQYLHKDVQKLLSVNQMSNATLSVGTLLIVGWLDLDKRIGSEEMKEEEKSSEDSKELKKDYKAANKKSSVVLAGKAFWKRGNAQVNEPYVLHNTAPINGVVQIYNPMSGRKMFAKVIGRIPERNYPYGTMIVITPHIAKELKAKDASFFVKIKFFK